MIAEYGGLGEFEHIVMLAVLNAEHLAYCRNVQSTIAFVTGRCPSIGAVHATLTRLERKGMLSSRIDAPTGVPGGRSKRVYAIEPNGLQALRRVRDVLRRSYAALSNPHRNSIECAGHGFYRKRAPHPPLEHGCRYPRCLTDYY